MFEDVEFPEIAESMGCFAVRVTRAGEVPSAADIPPGCPFHPRCWKAQDKCRTVVPQLDPLDGVRVACHFPE